MKRLVLCLLLIISASAVRAEERTYPSFPDAMTKRPSWLVNAPFDVDKYLESPPDEQNAAPLYLDALFEFSSDMAVCFHPAGEKPQGEVKRRSEAADKRYEEYFKFEQPHEENPKPVDNDAVDAWLAKYEPGFAKLAAAQKRPECVFETGMRVDPLLPQLQAVRQVARVLKWRARRDLARQNLDRPIQDVEILLRLTRDYQRQSGTLGQLVSMAVERTCYEDVVTPILQAEKIQKEHCDRLLKSLDRQEVATQQRFAEAVKGEYLWTRIAMNDLQFCTGEYNEKSMKAAGVSKSTYSPIDAFEGFFLIGKAFGFKTLLNEKYGNDPSNLPADHPFVAGWAIDGKLMTDKDYAKEIDATNQFYASLLKLADRTSRKRLAVIQKRKILDPLRATKVALFFEPLIESTASILLQNETELQATKCLITLRRWQIDHDGLPRDLKTIIKAAGMKRVPIDPYSDQPMKMTILDGQPVIYSVGPDGKDDQARKECISPGTDSAGDLIFRLTSKK